MQNNIIPKHVAIIMDGNGRWAKKIGKPRFYGHYKGAELVEPISAKCKELGIPYLTLFAFSTENWKRPEEETQLLFTLFKEYLIIKEKKIMKDNIRMRFIGRRDRIPKDLLDVFHHIEHITSSNNALTLTIAIDYGGTDDILRSFNNILKSGIQNITEKDIKDHLDTNFLPSVDLLIRTGNEKRISNFLLWDLAYAELFFCEKYWPDLTPEDLENIIKDFSERKRRFGGIIE